jgi:hypothetical protein
MRNVGMELAARPPGLEKQRGGAGWLDIPVFSLATQITFIIKTHSIQYLYCDVAVMVSLFCTVCVLCLF